MNPYALEKYEAMNRSPRQFKNAFLSNGVTVYYASLNESATPWFVNPMRYFD